MLKINEVERIYLGIQGENNARPITIDVSPWIALYPNGSVTIWHKRNGDSVPEATGAVYDSETMTVTWTPDDVDTYVDGEGDAEIRLTDTNVIKKSKWIKTCVSPSVTLAGTTLGSDWASYINAVDGLRAGAVAAKNAAVTAKNAAETAESNAEAWAVGQRGGEDVESTDPAYENNAKYYKEQAAGSASTASTASTAAVAAKNAAVAAQGAAEVAQLAAVVAQGKAETAQAAAENAQSAAESAQSSAETAKTGAISAKNDAISAKNDAVSAKNAAVVAQGAAETSATTASTKAGEAATSATTASTKAGEAATSAGTASTKASEAAASAGAAGTSALKAEGYAVGDQNGTPVTSGSPYYHNNAEYYAGQASDSAMAASGSATTAGTKALVAEGFAVGEQNGTPVTSGSPYYQNNAEYFAGEAADSATEAAASATAAEATTTMIAPAFDAETANDPGTYVTKDGVLYLLPEGHVEDEAWADTTKEETKVGTQLSGVKSALTQEKSPVILDTASGEIVTVPDGADGMKVETLTVAIEPVQDLHGQANPYPGGGGKNLLPLTVAGIKAENTSGTWSGNAYTLNGLTFTLQTDSDNNIIGINTNGTPSVTTSFYLATTFTNSNNCILNGCPSGGSYNSSYSIWSVSSNPYAERIDGGNGTPIEANTVGDVKIRIVGGYSVSNLVFKPMIRLSTVSDATFEPYSNLCPISGWSAAEVTRTGINLLDEVFESGGLTWANGEPIGGTDRIRTKNFNPIKPSTDYYTMRGLDYAYLFLYDKNKTFIEQYLMTDTVITTPNNAYWFKVVIMETEYKNEVSVNYPSTDHNHHPYAGGQTKTYTFPDGAGTVYGGTLTVNADGTGSLVVDRAKVDLGSLTWNYINSSDDVRGFYVFISDMIEGKTYAPVISSMYKTGGIKWANISDKEIGTNASGSPSGNTTQIIVKDSSYSDETVFKQAMTDNNVQTVYELATPVVYNLTALEVIELLKGVNNLWADCGNVTMQYPCDTKLFIERLTAPDDDDMIANANISSGKFFMVGNNLYISTSAIAQGETITPGTNCTAVSLADALNQINQ